MQGINDKAKIRAELDVILANRFDEDVLEDVEEKVYTKDLFRRDLQDNLQLSASIMCEILSEKKEIIPELGDS